MMAQGVQIPTIQPEGLSRVEAARFVGVGTTTFDKMVEAGELPKPRRSKVCRRVIWLASELSQSLRDLPVDGEEGSSEWDGAEL